MYQLNINENKKAANAAYIKAFVAYMVGDYSDARLECDNAKNFSRDNIELEKSIERLSIDIDKDEKSNFYYEEAITAKKAGNTKRAVAKARDASNIRPSNEYLRKKIEKLRQQLGDDEVRRNGRSTKLGYVLIALFVLALGIAIAVKSVPIGGIMPPTTTTVPTTSTVLAEKPTALPTGEEIAGVPSPQTPSEAAPSPTPTLTPLPSLTPTPTPTPTLTPSVLLREGVVIEDRVRLRAGAGTNYPIVHPDAYFGKRSKVRILDGPRSEAVPDSSAARESGTRCTSSQWYNVQAPGSDLKGWICADFLYIDGESTLQDR